MGYDFTANNPDCPDLRFSVWQWPHMVRLLTELCPTFTELKDPLSNSRQTFTRKQCRRLAGEMCAAAGAGLPSNRHNRIAAWLEEHPHTLDDSPPHALSLLNTMRTVAKSPSDILINGGAPLGVTERDCVNFCAFLLACGGFTLS